MPMTADDIKKLLNRLFPWRHARLNHKFKDHLFRFLFREKKDLLSLYNAVNGTDYQNPDDLTIMTLEDVIYLGMKNDVSFLIDGSLNLYEHQSSICPNMPLRGLFYFSQMLQGYVDQKKLNIYSSTKVSLPVPYYIVFYNGTAKLPERSELLLSSLFDDGAHTDEGNLPGSEEGAHEAEKSLHQSENGTLKVKEDLHKDAALECRAVVLNINAGYNMEIMKKCRTLADYSAFVQKIRDYQKEGFGAPQAVALAIDYCIENEILADVLRRNRGEVTDMILTVYNEKLHNRTLREEGRQEGLLEGRQEGARRVNALYKRLLEDSRLDDLKRSTEDPEYQELLLKEYKL